MLCFRRLNNTVGSVVLALSTLIFPSLVITIYIGPWGLRWRKLPRQQGNGKWAGKYEGLLVITIYIHRFDVKPKQRVGG